MESAVGVICPQANPKYSDCSLRLDLVNVSVMSLFVARMVRKPDVPPGPLVPHRAGNRVGLLEYRVRQRADVAAGLRAEDDLP